MRAGVGYANDVDARRAGRTAAVEALRRAGTAAPGLVLAFHGGALDAAAFLSGVREAVGPGAPVLGGSAIGVITDQALSYQGAPAAVAVLDLGGPLEGLACVGGLDAGEREAGLALGRALAARGAVDPSLLLLVYDSVRRPPGPASPPVLNASRPLVEGLREGLPGCPPVVGAGLLGDLGFSPTWQLCGGEAGRQRAAAALLGPAVRWGVQVMHGCTPMDGVPHVLTRVEGGVVHELDGRPAAEVIDEVYGSPDWRRQQPVDRLTLGVRQGPRHQPAAEDAWVARLVTGVMPDGLAIGLFEADLGEGAEVEFLLRDPALMIDSARLGSQALLHRLRREGIEPRLALYVDCAGRAAAVSRSLTEEADEVRAVMARAGVPLLGFYTGVEVAPVRGVSRGLDWTGVLLVLGEAAR